MLAIHEQISAILALVRSESKNCLEILLKSVNKHGIIHHPEDQHEFLITIRGPNNQNCLTTGNNHVFH